MSKSTFVPVAKPWLGEEEVEASARVIRSGWVTQGPEVAAFEREFADYVGSPYACAVSNCTTALHLALRVAGVGVGDEVITVSHSYIATANAIRHCGAVPVFVDIEPQCFNMDPTLVEAAITPRTRAILCVHQIGNPCDLAAILPMARSHNLPVIEDAACAIGGEILWDGQWEKIGRPHADAACFSFHPRKLVTTGDGGMITTRRADWDQRFRKLRQHSMSVSDVARHGSSDVVFESYPELGYNYRMTDIQAAVGRVQLKKLPEMIERRRQQAQRYREMLEGIPGLGLPKEPVWARANFQSFCVRLPDGTDQRAVMQSMLDDGVSTRRAVMCSHREPAYQTESWRCACSSGPHVSGVPCVSLKVSEVAQDTAVILPLFHEMTDAQQDQVAVALGKACRQGHAAKSGVLV